MGGICMIQVGIQCSGDAPVDLESTTEGRADLDGVHRTGPLCPVRQARRDPLGRLMQEVNGDLAVHVDDEVAVNGRTYAVHGLE